MTSPGDTPSEWPATPPGVPAEPGTFTVPKTSRFAIAALVLGILGVVLLSVIFGIIGLKQTKDGTRRGRGLAIAGLAISLVWIVAGAAVATTIYKRDRGTTSTQDLSLGQCIKDLPADSATTLSRAALVPCDQPHIGEVFAVIPVPGDTFPGEAQLTSQGDACDPKLVSYVPGLPDDFTYDLSYIYPTAQTWADGDRSLVCILRTDQPRAGSLNSTYKVEPGTIATRDLAVGNCIPSLPGGSDAKVSGRTRLVPCDQPHGGEVFAVIAVPDAPAYPDEAALTKLSDECDPKLVAYAPNLPDGPYHESYLYPTKGSWASGDRTLACILTTDQPRTGSIH